MSSDEVKLILERLDRIESRQGNMETGIVNLGTRLEALENIVEERLQDTRPLWEGVQMQLVEIRESQEKTASEVTEIKGEIRKLNRKIETFNNRLMEVEADQRDIEERVENLEKKVS
ncbi:MAG: hypothetical protein AB1631_06055 [Acidobacteriota bacterium]